MIKKTDPEFYKILHTLWLLASYYADYMGFSAPQCPLDMQIEITRRQGLSFFHVTLPAICIWDGTHLWKNAGGFAGISYV